ncbi:PBP1A family penicillin-binding protein [Bacillaceae bacterium SIJ1]|uniref:penicillin-binding protein 1A n=1 Tax=Litoribacterium kuwaitense TaxID=1398745 RepID=UPI0013ED7463|nr:penicillin-binding protein 1A [Litoribacterium kuwaitense]NGP43746.1 PBP1A family penicillin-binding protein [Litoribacterium kuwaitense]
MADQYKTRTERKKGSQRKTASSSTQKNKKPKKKGSLFKNIMLGLTIFFLLCISIAGVAAAFIIKDAPKISAEALESPLSSRIYDVNGNEIAELGMEKREQVNIDDIPDVVKDAFIATEDVRFKKHFGIDLRRIGGAVIANFQDGFGAEGASTITQQVVKNYLLTSEKTMTRKIQEAWLSIKLEQQYSKDQILELYLNKILFAQDIYGVAKATEFYFNKDITTDEITVEEAALLAGLPQSPNYYNPFRNPEAAEQRRNTVISLMEQHGFIDASAAEQAKAIPVIDSIVEKQDNPQPYDAYIDQVIEEFQAKTDIDLYSSGVEVYTHLDPEAQRVVEQALDTNQYVQYPDDQFQAGIAVVNTKTGGAAAIGGGRNQEVKRGYNYATDINRQPGSTIKPILDFAPAIEHLEWSTYHPIVDEPYEYSDGTPINNWDNRHLGQMTLRTALAKSRNIPALKAMQAVGLPKAKSFAEGLGIDVGENIYESYSIGGFNGVSPLEMAGAYSAFGNKGIYSKPHTIAKVVFPDGSEQSFTPEPTVAMKESTAFMTTDMLKSVMTSGTGTAANVSNVPVAGKTGTSNFDDETRAKYGLPQGAVPDSWFAGYSTEYSIAIWTGYPKTTSEYYMDYSAQQISKQLFRSIMTEISSGQVADFEQPDSVVRVGIEKGSNPPRLPSDFTPQSEIVYEYFIRGTEPSVRSERFEAEEPDAVSGLTATFDEEAMQVLLRWDSISDEATYEVEVSIDDGNYEPLTTTDETSVSFPDVIPGAIYSFRVTASENELTGPAASTTIEIPDGTEDDNDGEPGEDGLDDEESNPEESDGDGEENPDDDIPGFPWDDPEENNDGDEEQPNDNEEQTPPSGNNDNEQEQEGNSPPSEDQPSSDGAQSSGQREDDERTSNSQND